MDEKESPDPLEATRVDLGDDLLEKTAVLQGPVSMPTAPTAPPSVQITDPQDSFDSARILLSEGFQEEAKQLLRRILMEDPSHAGAKSKLAEIHELELKQILAGREPGRPRRLGTEQPEPTLRLDELDTEAIARELEKDLELDEPPLSLVTDAVQEAQFMARLRATLRSIDTQERIDLGIGFLEMGLGAAAALAFKEAAGDPFREFEAKVLLAQASFLSGRLGEAELILDEVLSRAGGAGSADLEARYWMGRVLESRGRWDLATAWFHEVARVDATHRDVLDRLRILRVRTGKR